MPYTNNPMSGRAGGCNDPLRLLLTAQLLSPGRGGKHRTLELLLLTMAGGRIDPVMLYLVSSHLRPRPKKMNTAETEQASAPVVSKSETSSPPTHERAEPASLS